MTIEKIINKWLAQTGKDLIKNYDKLGLRASGEWANSVESFNVQKNDSIKFGIKANHYTKYLENGRNKNQDQSEEGIKKWVGWAGSTFLAKWVKDKNIDISPYAVAYKIAREGWKVPNKNNKGGLVSDVITDKNIESLMAELSKNYVSEFTSKIRKTYGNN